MSIYLNGRYMRTKEGTHAYLKRRLHFPDYYGANLDALYDLLTTWVWGDIVLKNADTVREQLGDYAESLISVFNEAAENCCHLSFKEA